MALEEYWRKRDFRETPEPAGDRPGPAPQAADLWHRLPQGQRYCVQMHRATRLHYDFRLEHGGVLLSWAVPRGPSLDPARKRLAVQTEDHPLDYGDFEGVIPSGYGMGTVELWDAGTFTWTRESARDPDGQISRGDIKFQLSGEKLAGEFALVRIVDRAPRPAGAAEAQRSFLLIKKRDEAALAGHEAADHDGSVKSGRTLDEIAAQGGGDPRERQRARRRGAREAVHAPAGSLGVAPARPPGPAGPPAGPPPAAHPSLDPVIEEALEELSRMGAAGSWRIGPRRLRLTNLDKPLWPDPVITKRQMIDYYVRMSPYLLPYLQDRPLSMQVFPDGITGHSFWRKDKPAHAPEWIDSWLFRGEGGSKTWIVVNEAATLGWLANAGVVDLHPWHSRIDSPQRPDWAVFDLDPSEPATFEDVRDIARLVKVALDHLGMRGVLKTSGQTGLQIYVTLRRGPDYTRVRGWVEEVARASGRVEPDRISWEWSVSRRAGRIRIDYTQNIINKTLAAPYSLRPGPGAPVSTPLRWEELEDPRLRSDAWTMATIWERLRETGDLFGDVLGGDQDLPGRWAPPAA